MDINNPVEVISAMTVVDWGFVALACGIVFAILGPRMFRDIKGWLA